MVSWVVASTPSRALFSGFLPHLAGRDWEACFASCACVSQGVLAFLEARLVGPICLPVVQSHRML
ncbi:hypothetical protein ACRRTK_016312 [Alexandromys fortis]